ncbi:GNAT family N-acetyltransferase [Allopusillimonas soli]|uniref:GNAT family N-acetyltransferase n=1 Tax=Allopusillimonas soli TaxID=659016 RepID=A0A853F4M4_9BURK|nr:GNAT family N-acetyltransferase [Allopusillimonas soli]NYT35464.1 GNAT family N-acetyltransferase [Allopusillimonas soli]TEA75878.1 GNAT family N-acetyltransferase [Allopusillimonas soli]
MNQTIRIAVGDWASSKHDAVAIRQEVFVEEQNVPVELELDGLDSECVHAVAYNEQDQPIATGRLLPDGHIGRLAVLADYRGTGVGSKILDTLVNEARRRRHMEVVLSAQTHARNFYARHGFVAEGGTYMDAGIEHVTMRHSLTA